MRSVLYGIYDIAMNHGFINIFISTETAIFTKYYSHPRTIKWNPIKHRLFAPISQNWYGRPLKSLNYMIKLISHTRT